jgi:hypothetical protein
MLMELKQVAGDFPAALYEIRTNKSRLHTSLTMLVECRDDIAAIVIARKFTRKGDGTEVWLGDTIVYRSELYKVGTVSPPIRQERAFSIFSSERWFQWRRRDPARLNAGCPCTG